MKNFVQKIGEINLTELISKCKEVGWLDPIDNYENSPRTFSETRDLSVKLHQERKEKSINWTEDLNPKQVIHDTIPDFIHEIENKFNAQKFRVMCLPPLTTLDYHTDFNKRVNIPLITNGSCFYIFEDNLFKLPADGSVYMTDTTVRHTAVNSSNDYRYHLIGYLNE